MSNEYQQDQGNQHQEVRVVVTDVDISFGQAVSLLVKFAVAAIPAAIILGLVAGSVALLLAFIVAALK